MSGIRVSVLALTVLLLAANVNLRAQDAELPRLAVVEFSTNVSTDKIKADSITVRNLVESQMVGTGKYQVMTRAEIDKLLNDQKIQISSISSAENIKKLKLENISYIVTGSVDAMDNDYAIAVKVLDVATGKFSHSADDFMGSGSRDLYNGISKLMSRFTAGMSSAEDGTIVQGKSVARPVSGTASGSSSTGIAIEVSTKSGGTLYFQGEEIASLWANDTHSIPIDKPGTYIVKMVFSNGVKKNQSVVVSARGVIKVAFTDNTYTIGDEGPGGGIVFSVGNGKYLECSGELGSYNWDSANSAARNYRGGEKSDWRLPTKDELNMMYVNLKQKGLGGFGEGWYWSSSPLNSDIWVQKFSDGYQRNYNKSNTSSVRAVRAFNP